MYKFEEQNSIVFFLGATFHGAHPDELYDVWVFPHVHHLIQLHLKGVLFFAVGIFWNQREQEIVLYYRLTMNSSLIVPCGMIFRDFFRFPMN